MKMKKFLALVMTASMVVGLAGCGSTTTTTESKDATATEGAAEGKEEGTEAATTESGEPLAVNHEETLTIEIYDQAANYQGLQTGWFQKIVNEKFNLELNIIAPQVSGDGDALYQTRVSAGNLGDICIIERDKFADCVKTGLMKNITADVYNYSNLAEYQEQIDKFNAQLEGSNGELFGIPTQMTNSSPTSYSQDVIYTSPMMQWNLYKGIGEPEMKDLDDLLDALEAMKEKYPTNADGDACYPFSLWADWDGNQGMENVAQLISWYGEYEKGSLLMKADGSVTPVTDDNGAYHKMLKFLNTAYLRGLVDPDSGTQDWNSACAKMSAGRVYLFWYSWQRGFWNSTDRFASGDAYIYTPVADCNFIQTGDSYYGTDRVFCIGSGVDDAKYARIMEFLDWYASPEGLLIEHAGIEGFNFTVEDGVYTRINDNALMDNLPVPEEYGGAGYQDGNNAINQWIVDSTSTNPVTGELYNPDYWRTTVELTMPGTRTEWGQKFGAANQTELLQNNKQLSVIPYVK